MSITNFLKLIINAKEGWEVRGAIHDAIKQTYEDASKSGNANMEIAKARGGFSELDARLNNSDEQLANLIMQMLQKANARDLQNLRDLINSIIAQSGTSDTEVVQARQDIYGRDRTVLKDRLDDIEYFEWLLNDNIIGTNERVERNEEGRISRVYHTRASDNVDLRIDSLYWYLDDQIVMEDRVLFTGEGIRLVTDLRTLETTVRRRIYDQGE